MNKFIEKLEGRLLLISILFFLLPAINLTFIYTQGVVKILVLLIFLNYLVTSFSIRSKKLLQQDKIIPLLLIITITTSLSIINTISIVDFIKRYYDFIVPIMLFLILRRKLKTDSSFKRQLLRVFLISFTINTLLALWYLVDSSSFVYLTNTFLQSVYFNYLTMNIDRGRIFFPSYNEAIIPLIFYLLLTNKKSWLLGFLILIQSFISFKSGFRTFSLMILISYIGTLFVYYKNKSFVNLFILFLFISTLFGGYQFLHSRESIIDRFLLTNSEDKNTVIIRVNQIPIVFNLGTKLIAGTGLGNYFYYINLNKFHQYYGSDRELVINDQMPHNYFLEKLAETGLLGFISYFTLILFFLITDIHKFFLTDKFIKICIISFWSLFTYAFFNPSYGISYNVLFFTLRAFI